MRYGLTTSYGLHSAVVATPVKNHSVKVAGLQPNKTYHYRVISRDAAGNERVLDDLTFTTRP